MEVPFGAWPALAITPASSWPRADEAAWDHGCPHPSMPAGAKPLRVSHPLCRLKTEFASRQPLLFIRAQPGRGILKSRAEIGRPADGRSNHTDSLR
jgi:hypothetical protein